MADEKFKLKVLSREGPIYDGEATSISSYNEKGLFDVLAHHANFIAIIDAWCAWIGHLKQGC